MKKIIFTLIISLFSFNGFANDSKKAQQFIKDLTSEILTIASDKKISEDKKKKQIINKVDISVDSNWISRFVLGRNYRQLSKLQQDKFKDLYRRFMINTYGPTLQKYSNDSFNVLSAEKRNIFYVVNSEFDSPDSNAPVNIVFRVRQQNNKFLILDIVAEGVSLIESQRDEFSSAISREGIEKFIENLSKKVRKLEQKQN